MLIAEVFGFVAAFLGVVQAWPQAVRVRALGHGRGVSIVTWLMTAATSASWLGFGLRVGSPSLVVSTFASGVMNSWVVLSLVRGRRGVLVGLVAGFVTLTVLARFLPGAVVNPFLFFLTLRNVPQVVTSWRSLREGTGATAVSMRSVAAMILSLVFWEFYSVLMADPTLIGTTTIALTLTVTVAVLEQSARRRAAA